MRYSGVLGKCNTNFRLEDLNRSHYKWTHKVVGEKYTTFE